MTHYLSWKDWIVHFCAGDKFLLTQKLARVPQTMPIELMVHETLLKSDLSEMHWLGLV